MRPQPAALAALGLLGACGLSALAFLASVHREDATLPAPPSATPGSREHAGTQHARPLALPEKEAARADADDETARGFLREYWGADWDRIRAALEREGLDLDATGRPPPWEDVAAEFETLLPLTEEERRALLAAYDDWPRPVSAEWIRERYDVALTLEPADVIAIEALALPENIQLGRLGAAYLVLMDQALRDGWTAEQYVKAPFSCTGVRQPDGPMRFYSTTKKARGWCMRIALDLKTHANLVDMYAAIRQAQAKRDHKVREHLRSLKIL